MCEAAPNLFLRAYSPAVIVSLHVLKTEASCTVLRFSQPARSRIAKPSLLPHSMAEVLVPMAGIPVETAAHQAPADAVPVPPQYQQARVNDFRGAGFAPKGFREKAVKSTGSKRKLEEYQEQVHPFCGFGYRSQLTNFV